MQKATKQKRKKARIDINPDEPITIRKAVAASGWSRRVVEEVVAHYVDFIETVFPGGKKGPTFLYPAFQSGLKKWVDNNRAK